MASNSRTRQRSGARPGDATGMIRDQKAKEMAPAIAEASRGMTLINPPVVERSDEVVDYSGGGDANVGNEDGVRLISIDEAVSDGETGVTIDDMPESEVDIDALPDGTTDVRPEMIALDEPQAKHQPVSDEPRAVVQTGEREVVREAPKVETEYRIMRVNTDLEDVTIGKDNHYTFREGVRYKVTKQVYDHLDEKGYVYH